MRAPAPHAPKGDFDAPREYPMNTTNNQILAAVEALREDVGEIKADLRIVKDEVKVTNGRVTRLEMWRHGLEAVIAARSWIKPAAIAFVSGAGLSVLAFFLNQQ
jgi:hypothetical protein